MERGKETGYLKRKLSRAASPKVNETSISLTATSTKLRNTARHIHDAYIRRHILRREDLPRKGIATARCPINRDMNHPTELVTNRASSISVETARSSASRMARLNPYSYNARIPAVLRGRCYSESNTRKAFRKCVSHLLRFFLPALDSFPHPRHREATLTVARHVYRKSPRSARGAQ